MPAHQASSQATSRTIDEFVASDLLLENEQGCPMLPMVFLHEHGPPSGLVSAPGPLSATGYEHTDGEGGGMLECATEALPRPQAAFSHLELYLDWSLLGRAGSGLLSHSLANGSSSAAAAAAAVAVARASLGASSGAGGVVGKVAGDVGVSALLPWLQEWAPFAGGCKLLGGLPPSQLLGSMQAHDLAPSQPLSAQLASQQQQEATGYATLFKESVVTDAWALRTLGPNMGRHRTALPEQPAQETGAAAVAAIATTGAYCGPEAKRQRVSGGGRASAAAAPKPSGDGAHAMSVQSNLAEPGSQQPPGAPELQKSAVGSELQLLMQLKGAKAAAAATAAGKRARAAATAAAAKPKAPEPTVGLHEGQLEPESAKEGVATAFAHEHEREREHHQQEQQREQESLSPRQHAGHKSAQQGVGARSRPKGDVRVQEVVVELQTDHTRALQRLCSCRNALVQQLRRVPAEVKVNAGLLESGPLDVTAAEQAVAELQARCSVEHSAAGGADGQGCAVQQQQRALMQVGRTAWNLACFDMPAPCFPCLLASSSEACRLSWLPYPCSTTFTCA